MAEINRRKLLVHEAKRWLRLTEKGGQNKGQVVELFQKAVDGKAEGESWCMSFVQFCLCQVDLLVQAMWPEIVSIEGPNILYKSEHCATTWNMSPVQQRRYSPKPGYIAIYKNPNGSNGHTGIVVSVESDDSFWLIEGNTSSGEAGSQSDGDGVYLRKRTHHIGFGLKLLGFLDPYIDP